MFWGDDMNVEKNMFTIGEMAKSIGITRKIILNYEAKGLITPDFKDGKNGNRYYTVDTFTKIRTVRILQKLGLSLDEIHAYLDGETDLLPLIRRLEAMRDEINLNIEKLYERANTNPTQIKEIHIDKQTIYRRTFTTESILDKTNILRDTAILAMREYGTDMTRRMYFLEYSLSAPNEISYCVAVPPESSGEHIVVLTQCVQFAFIITVHMRNSRKFAKNFCCMPKSIISHLWECAVIHILKVPRNIRIKNFS